MHTHTPVIGRLLGAMSLLLLMTPTAFAQAAPKPSKLEVTAARTAPPTRGSAKARVEIVEFTDFQCPFCQRVQSTLDDVAREFGSDVRFVLRHNPLPFHKRAMPAALAAAAAGTGRAFWTIKKAMFANQKRLTDVDLEGYARRAGVSMGPWTRARASARVGALVERDQRIARAVGATGTPGFMINGVALRGAQPLSKFREVIEAEIAASKKAGRRGSKWIAARTRRNNPTLHRYTYGKQVAPPVTTTKRRPRPVDKTVYKVTLTGKEATRGPADALVTLVVFSNYQCPFCKRLEPTLAKIRAHYGDAVRVVAKHSPLPFHKNAFRAAEAAECAGEEGRFWAMHDRMFAHQRDLRPVKLVEHAKAIGLSGTSLARFTRCLVQRKHERTVLASLALASQVTARGTPNTFVNGRKLTGAKPFDEFQTAIDEELAKARALVRKGTPRNLVYETTIGKGSVFQVLDSTQHALPVAHSPTLGDPQKAKAVVTVFADFECPFCARLAPRLREAYTAANGQLAVVFKHFPLSFHRNAQAASYAALCADKQGLFWEFFDRTYASLNGWKKSPDPKAALAGIAMGVGALPDPFAGCLSRKGALKRIVDTDMALGRKVGVRGTPSIYINGRKFSSASGYTAHNILVAAGLRNARHSAQHAPTLNPAKASCNQDPKTCRAYADLLVRLGAPGSRHVLAADALRRGCDAGDAEACTRWADRQETGNGVRFSPDGAAAARARACSLGAGPGCSKSPAPPEDDLEWDDAP